MSAARNKMVTITIVGRNEGRAIACQDNSRSCDNCGNIGVWLREGTEVCAAKPGCTHGSDIEAGVQAGGRDSVTARRLRSFTITVERGI